MFIIIFLIWIVFGLVCYKLAEKQGRNKIVGFIAGLLFGLLAVIVYLILGETEAKKDERVARLVKEMKK